MGFRQTLVLAITLSMVGFLVSFCYTWHKNNFVYLPDVVQVESNANITTLYTNHGDAYVIEP